MQAQQLITLLQNCRQTKNLNEATRIHAYVRQHGLESHPVLGNYLMPLLVDCGRCQDAEDVFNRLPHRTEYLWTSLISGFVSAADPQHGFALYHDMREEGVVPPTRYTYLALLNACDMLRDAEKGRGIHAEITKRGMEKELYLGSTLVDMYTKCDSFGEACLVFDGLPARNVVSWNAIIAGYANHGLTKEIERCFEQMQLEGTSPDSVTFVCSSKACSTAGALHTGHGVHAEITKRGLEVNNYVGNTLVDMYSKCGSVAEAHKVFDGLQVQDTISWASLISGYTELGLHKEARNCFQLMQLRGTCPDSGVYVCSLKACGILGDSEMGRGMHMELIKRGLDRDANVGNTIMDMYMKCGFLADAQQVFDQLLDRDAVTWNVLISGFSELDLGEEILNSYHQMRREGSSAVDAVTFACTVKACASSGDIKTGQILHTELVTKGLERELHAGSSLVQMYSKCGLLVEARQVYDGLPAPQPCSWAVLLAGYAEHGLHEEAESLFQRMEWGETYFDSSMFICILKACGSVGAIGKGQEIHADIIKTGYERDTYVSSTLVDMYAKGSLISEARQLFQSLPVRNAVLWNVLLAGYAEHGLVEEVRYCFKQMQHEGISPDSVSFICSLKACGSTRDLQTGQLLHAESTKTGLERDLHVGNSLVNMYTKCSSLGEAYHVFDRLPARDTASWNTFITGYAEQGDDGEVLNCFKQMQLEGATVSHVSFSLCLKACGSTGALETGREIHARIKRSGLEKDLVLGNTLIDMYGKCGSVAEGREVFDNMLVRDLVSWTALIKAYSENHEVSMALQCFEDMREQGVKPDSVLFTCLLAACSHASLVGKGQQYWKLMVEEYGIEPTVDHYLCIIDLFGRSGHVYEAERFLAATRCAPSSSIIMSLLSACKIYGEVELGQRCFQQLVEMNLEDSSAFLLISDLYTSTGRWHDAKRVEEMRQRAGAKKKPGSALLEVNKHVQEFVVGIDPSEGVLIVIKDSLLRHEGYVPNIDIITQEEVPRASNSMQNLFLCSSGHKINSLCGKSLSLCNDSKNGQFLE